METLAESRGGVSPDGNTEDNKCARTQTHFQKEEEKRLFGHSFCTLENVTKAPTAVCVSGLCRVCARVCAVTVAWLNSPEKGGFPLVTLNLQQLFGTFNIY